MGASWEKGLAWMVCQDRNIFCPARAAQSGQILPCGLQYIIRRKCSYVRMLELFCRAKLEKGSAGLFCHPGGCFGIQGLCGRPKDLWIKSMSRPE